MADAIRWHYDIRRKLTVLARSFSGADVAEIAFGVGEAVRDFMVLNYLRGQRLRRITGRLSSSFKTQKRPDQKSAVLGTNVVYALVHEFGFRGENKLGRRMNLKERRYFRDAIKNSKREQLAAINVQVARILKKATRG